MLSLLPHDLCHGRSSSRWLPAVLEFQLSYSRSWKMILWKVLHSICNMPAPGSWHHLIPCGLLDWGPQIFVGYWLEAALCSSLYGLLHMTAYKIAACFFKACRKESLLAGHIKIFCNNHIRVFRHPIIPAIFYCLEASPMSYLHSRGGSYIRAWTPGSGDHESHPRICLPQVEKYEKQNYAIAGY